MTKKQQLASDLKMVGYLGGLVTEKQDELSDFGIATIQEALITAQNALYALQDMTKKTSKEKTK